MRKWRVKMSFVGDVEGDTSFAATKEFKRLLGLAPESMRPEVSMVDLQTRLIWNEEEAHPDAVAHD